MDRPWALGPGVRPWARGPGSGPGPPEGPGLSLGLGPQKAWGAARLPPVAFAAGPWDALAKGPDAKAPPCQPWEPGPRAPKPGSAPGERPESREGPDVAPFPSLSPAPRPQSLDPPWP